VTFVRIPGLSGKLYVPEPCPAAAKKHPCRDCFGCQRCSDDRCSLCRTPDPEPSRSKGQMPKSETLPR